MLTKNKSEPLVTVKYAFFALIATGVNLTIQWSIFALFDGFWVLYVALAAGTITGLITKYVLDKKWIFYYTAANKRDDMVKFSLYTLMGVITTAIFWGTEMAFFYIFDFKGAQYVGGALGLTAGYITKYLLDKKYVFKNLNVRKPSIVYTFLDL